MKNKVCIIGCGMIATSAHIPAYLNKSDDFEIAAVSDFNEALAKSVAEKFNIPRYYKDTEKMLDECNPDVVSVCTPNLTHKKYVMAALKKGANVLCEKPLAVKYSDALEMFNSAKEKGKVLMACQSLRFLPERLAAAEQVREGKVGNVYYSEFSRIRRRGIPTWGKFHIKEFSGGGAFLDIGVHAVDSAVWLMGNPKPVSVSTVMQKVHTDEIGSDKASGALKGGVNTSGFNPDEMNVESFASGSVRFENGASMTFRVSWAANLPEENNIVISGEKCGINLEKRKIYFGEDKEENLSIVPNGFKDEPFFGHFCLVENFANVLKGKEEPFIKPEETLNVTAIIEAAYLSAEKQKEILLKELF